MNGMLQDNPAENEFAPKPPRLATVITFVAAFSIIVSWLGVYGVTNALVAAGAIDAFQQGADPRGKWMLQCFGGFFVAFTLISLFFTWSSWRQMKQIDDMANAEDRFAD